MGCKVRRVGENAPPIGPAPAQIVPELGWLAFHTRSTVYAVNLGLEMTLGNFPGWADVVGFDLLGNPVVKQTPTIPSSDPRQTYSLVLVRSPDGSRTTIWQGVGATPGNTAIGDLRGVWFEVHAGGGVAGAAGSGLYLWTPEQGARLIAAHDGNLAGVCW